MNDTPELLRHVAVIMDGNGRWAVERGLPRGAGHQAGVKTLRNIVEHCARRRIEVLTVFAFSSENWKRPRQEVDLLMELFLNSLKNEVSELHKNGIRLRFIGDRQAFPAKLQELITATESKTRDNQGLTLVIAANYGGRWDITEACRRISAKVQANLLAPADIDETLVHDNLSLADLPDPDLFIRTGGERRISNYLLWQCAYSELYFCEVLWPDFSPADFDDAVTWYEGRQRRFGRLHDPLSPA